MFNLIRYSCIGNVCLIDWLNWEQEKGTCMSFAMLDFTVIGQDVGRLFMFGWLISF